METIKTENKNILISVIVPVFNIAAGLPYCVGSILQQTYSNFELLLVDDGSTDGSNKVCDELAATDDRIHVIHQKNAGVSVARNIGLREAKGEYIAFIDGDDIVSSDYLEYLLTGMKENTALSMCGHMRIHSYDPIFFKRNENFHYFISEDCAKRLLCGRFPIGVWGCLLRRDLLNDIRFPPGVRSNEDKLFLYRYLLKNEDQEVAFTNDLLYGYYVREDSASKSGWNGNQDVICVADEIEDITIKYHPEWKIEAKNSKISARLNTLKTILLNNGQSDKEKQNLKQIRKEILEIGRPKNAGYRTQAEYTCLKIGSWCYMLLVKLFYGITSDEKRYKTNEKRIKQV